MDRLNLIEAVKNSGLRGRGGAGFNAGMKWRFSYSIDRRHERLLQLGRPFEELGCVWIANLENNRSGTPRRLSYKEGGCLKRGSLFSWCELRRASRGM